MGAGLLSWVVLAVLWYVVSLVIWLLPLDASRSWGAIFTNAFFSWCIFLITWALWEWAKRVYHRRRSRGD
jgi:hypothetical protein